MPVSEEETYARNLSFTEFQLVQFFKTIMIILKLKGKKESTRL